MSDSSVQNAQTVLSEVANRLRQTEQRAATVVSALERHNSVQDSLDVTRKGLQEAGSAISELAREAKRATNEFQSAVLVLRSAVDVLDPAALKSSLDSINQSTGRIEAEIENLRNHIDEELIEIRAAVNGTADRTVERLKPRTIWEGMFGRRKE